MKLFRVCIFLQIFSLIHHLRLFAITLLMLSHSLLAADYLAADYKVTLLTEDDGFDSSIIFSIIQDKLGFLWFGSGYEGLYRYDGKKVKAFKHQVDNNNSLPHNNAGNLFIDNANNLWIGSWGGGVSQYDPQSSSFTHFDYNPDDLSSVSDTHVQNIYQDSQGDIWLGTFRNGLNKFNPETQSFTRFPFGGKSSKATSASRIWDIIEDNENSLWIGTSYGLNHFDKLTNSFTYYLPAINNGHADANKIRKIIKGDEDNLFLATDLGVWLFNINNKSFTSLKTETNEKITDVFSMIKTSFNQYWLTSALGVFSFSKDDLILKKVNLGVYDLCSQTLFEDKENNIWLSCEGFGIYKIVPKKSFNLVTIDLINTPKSVVVLNNDSLLIGTSNDLLNFDPISKKLTSLNVPANTKAQVNYLFQSKNDDIWYVSQDNLYRFNQLGVQQIIPPLGDSNNKQFKNIKAIEQDAFDRIWIGTLHDGVFIIDNLSNSFTHLYANNGNKGLTNNEITSIYRDLDNRMWVSSHHGVNLYNENNTDIKHFYFDKNENVDNPNNIVHVVFQDSKKRMWIGSTTGIHQLNENTGNYITYDVTNGLSNNSVNYITEDDYGNLWLVTDVGVSHFNPEDNTIKNYNGRDGLSQSRNFHSLSTSSKGIIYFASRIGVHYINPHSINKLSEQDNQANTVLTNFEILGSTKNEPPYYHPQTSAISLARDENNMKFEFATLAFSHSQQIKYSYKLEGFNEHWIDNDKNNSAIYTNLDGGNYTFKVRSLYRDDELYEDALSITLTVETQIWQRWWMYSIYCALILLFVQYYIKRKEKKQHVEIIRQKQFVTDLEQQVKEKTASIEQESLKRLEATQVKSQFLANMSHEIRTPLTSIIGQSEAIINDEIDPRDLHAEVEIIYNQSHYLLNLINDILDLSKIEANKLNLNVQQHSLIVIINELHHMFNEQAKVKGIEFKVTHNLPDDFIIKLDGLRLKQILINLCSNAVKFTRNGEVLLNVSLENDQLFFHVSDTGIGMTDEQLLHIFDSFSQGDNSISRRFGGSGLGLNLSEQLAEKMGGYIQVESEWEKGSVFSFILPYNAKFTNKVKPDDLSIEPSISYDNLSLQGTILLAEDHHDNRRLITRILKKLGLDVIAVSNGREAVEMYFKHQPQVVLLDIQMPVMDGIEAIKVLKEQGCKAKIIALTANAMHHEIKEFIALGFDEHLKKPIERNKFIATVAQYYQTKAPLNDEQIAEFEYRISNVDMSDLIEKFSDSLAVEHENILRNQKNNDMDSMAKQMHQLAGAAQVFGFEKLANCALKVEIAIKKNKVDQIQALTDMLIDELDKILKSQNT